LGAGRRRRRRRIKSQTTDEINLNLDVIRFNSSWCLTKPLSLEGQWFKIIKHYLKWLNEVNSLNTYHTYAFFYRVKVGVSAKMKVKIPIAQWSRDIKFVLVISNAFWN